MSLLSARGISYHYPGGPPVLSGVTLALEAREIAAVLGANGAGKSTLLDICLGWKKPTKGAVTLDGRPCASLGGAERGRLMSLVPQRENARFDFTVEDYALLGRAPYIPALGAPGSADRAAVARALREAGIAHLARRAITRLSGGEYQLMLIARSLAQEASILLLDEPASQLDPAHQARVLRLVRSLARRGIAVLFTSHSPQAAASIADTVHLLKRGRLMASGAPRAVLTGEHLTRLYGIAFTARWGRAGFTCSPSGR
jgi:iron complex transport system ATP-binding protein